MQKSLGEYPKYLSSDKRQLYEQEVQNWIDNEIVVPYDPVTHGDYHNILTLVPVIQTHKVTTPVRPVLDYRYLNSYVIGNPGNDVPVCDEFIRKWGTFGSDAHMLDIKKAFLQVFVSASKLKYQAIKFRGKMRILTRMGFGFKSAPRGMTRIVHNILDSFSSSRVPRPRSARIDSYIDDIYVDNSVVLCKDVKERFENFGLQMKDPVALSESSVLGIQVYRPGSNLFWRRNDQNSIDCPDVLTKRSLFAWCGRLVAHYPVAGFLRISCSYLKRVAKAWSEGWDQVLSSAIVDKCQSLQGILKKNDPVGGPWSVSGSDEATLCADANSIGIGALVEIGGHMIEDVVWISDQSDVRHINVAELEASIKALSLATKWKLRCFVLKIDSVTVIGWLNKVINNVSRVR